MKETAHVCLTKEEIDEIEPGVEKKLRDQNVHRLNECGVDWETIGGLAEKLEKRKTLADLLEKLRVARKELESRPANGKAVLAGCMLTSG